MAELTHFDGQGQAHMVDVSGKAVTDRIAVAEGWVRMRPETLALVEQGTAKKGDVLGIARLAGIMGAKKTADLIPLCHPLPITKVTLDLMTDAALPGVRITGPAGTTVAQDLEPEFIAIAPNNQTAYVACQENNAIVVIDIKRGKVMDVFGLGLKDHSLPGNGLDPSNRDGGIAIANWPVMGLYMPDSMVAYESDGEFYLVTANEGDAREWGDYIDEARVGDMGEDGLGVLDPTLFPNADDLMKNANLGRIKFVTTEGDLDGDGDYDQIVTFGARSFSIWNTKGQLVFDSGDAFERITAQLIPEGFNSDNGEGDSADSRSDDKGPEPEGLAIGKIKGRTYAFVGLERVGGIMVFDITQPAQSRFVTYVNNRDFSVEFDEDNLDNIVAAGDLGPEGLAFVPAHESPSRQPLLLVGNEVSGTFTIYAITEVGGKGKGPRSK